MRSYANFYTKTILYLSLNIKMQQTSLCLITEALWEITLCVPFMSEFRSQNLINEIILFLNGFFIPFLCGIPFSCRILGFVLCYSTKFKNNIRVYLYFNCLIIFIVPIDAHLKKKKKIVITFSTKSLS